MLAFVIILIIVSGTVEKAGRDDVDDAEASALADHQVRLVHVFGQNKVTASFLDEVYAIDLIAFVEDKFLRRTNGRLEQRADPRDEVLVFALQEVHLIVDLLVDIHRQLLLECERQIFNEV